MVEKRTPKRGIREPVVPEERYETLRHRIVSMLKVEPSTAKELAGRLRIPEKDVYEHLEHIRKTMNKGPYRLQVEPARCERCGFVFRKRGRLKAPGKCPMCRNESLVEPLFSVEGVDK
jgi:predicted Zn-ribbon and HTH transcriptional regulator